MTADDRFAHDPGFETTDFDPESEGSDAAPAPQSDEPAARLDTPPGFTPQELLEGDLPDLPPRELAALLCRHMLRLQAVEAQVDLVLGDGLRKLKTTGGHVHLGASTFESYCTSVLGFSASHASEVMRLQARLAALPKLSMAFTSGAVGRSRLRVVLPHARPEHDAALVGLCRTRSVRALTELVRSGALAEDGVPPAPAEDAGTVEEELDGVLSLSVTAQERAQVMGWGRRLVRAVLGADVPTWQCLEALAADALSALPPGVACQGGVDELVEGSRDGALTACAVAEQESPDTEPACEHVGRHEHDACGARTCGAPRGRRKRTRRARLDLRAAERRARKALLRSLDALPVTKLPDVARATQPEALDETLRDLVRLRRTIECERSLLLLWLHRRRLYLALGHATFSDLVQHRLGLSPREAVEGLELQSKLLMRCTGLARAYRAGDLPAHVVSVLRLVVRPETEGEWIAHAKRCSWKRLLLEADLLLALRGSMPASEWEELTHGGRPMPDLALPQLQLDFQEALGSLARRRRRQAERAIAGRRGVCMEAEAEVDDDGDSIAPMGVRTALLRVEAPSNVVRVVREALEAVKRRLGVPVSDGAALILMLRDFLVTYSADPTVQECAWKVAILERDGWQCSMPHCRRRCGLEVHHVIYRSHQGPDEPWNLLTLCGPCHRHLQHAGRARISGRAPETLTVAWGAGRHRQEWRHGLRVA